MVIFYNRNMIQFEFFHPTHSFEPCVGKLQGWNQIVYKIFGNHVLFQCVKLTKIDVRYEILDMRHVNIRSTLTALNNFHTSLTSQILNLKSDLHDPTKRQHQ